MPGPEIWANAASTLLRGVPLRDAPAWLNLILIVILGSVVPLGSLQVRPRRALLGAGTRTSGSKDNPMGMPSPSGGLVERLREWTVRR